MRLQRVSLQGRRFAIQLSAIVGEFRNVIPWLEGVQDLASATNGAYVRDELLRRMQLDEEGIVPYQFVLGDRSKAFAGGILAFDRSPERFRDPQNADIAEQLKVQGAGYISCLQVLPGQRGTGTGDALMRRALPVILKERGSVWGVVSNRDLLAWYASLGAQIRSPPENKDHLWIVTW
ncbi:MAG: hypothetical protein AAB839_02965 [Patescibacteria group bacterium]